MNSARSHTNPALHRRIARGMHLAFLPHPHNNHQPHALRLRAIRFYSILLIAAKLFITGFLFLVYPTSGTFSSLTAGRMLQLVNASRAESGVSALTTNAQLTSAAAAKANDLIASNYFAHTSPSGKQFFQWVRDAGYVYSLAGENLAKDFSSAEAAHNALMASELHKKNLLNGKFRDVGIAVLAGTIDGKETYVLVEMFGAPPVTKPIPQAVARTPAPTPAPVPTPAPEPAPTPVPQQPPKEPAPTLPAPVPPTYRAVMTEQSHEEIALTSDQAVSVRVAFQNTGTATWNEPIQLVTESANASQSLYDPTWASAQIVASAAEQSVQPGGVAHLLFTVRGGASEGAFTQHFNLESSEKRIEEGTVTLRASVTNPQLTAANPEPVLQETIPQAGEAVLTAGALATKASMTTALANALARNPDLPFWAFLSFISLLLGVNILVRIRHQHPHLVFHTVLVIVLTATLILTNVHFLERVATNLVIR